MLHRILRAVQPIMKKIADLLPIASGKGQRYRHRLCLSRRDNEAEDCHCGHVGAAFFIGFKTAQPAVPGLYEKALVQSRAFGKLQSDGRLPANQSPSRIAKTAEAGNLFIPYDLQSLVNDGCCKPGLQLDAFQHRKMQGDILVFEVIHGLV